MFHHRQLRFTAPPLPVQPSWVYAYTYQRTPGRFFLGLIMLDRLLPSLLAALLLIAFSGCAQQGAQRTQADPALDKVQPIGAGLRNIEHIIVIYGENRSFDHLYGLFPGANGIHQATAQNSRQTDRDGSVLASLPPVWAGVNQEVPQSAATDLPNAPFRIERPCRMESTAVRPYTRSGAPFLSKPDADQPGQAGSVRGVVRCGRARHGSLRWIAAAAVEAWREYTLADNTFMAAFGGSFLNHFWLVCACTPLYPDAATSPAKDLIAKLDADGVSLTRASSSPASALLGPPKFDRDGALTPDGYAVNTMQPPYQPSGSPPAAGSDPRFADPAEPTRCRRRPEDDRRHAARAKGISWAWYAGAWNAAVADGRRPAEDKARRDLQGGNAPNFQPHHQPFNYFARFAPGTADRDAALKDGDGLRRRRSSRHAAAVAFYKPQGNLKQHPGYADIERGDKHIAELIEQMQKSPQWNDMRDRHLRRERRLLGPRAAARGRPLGARHAHSGA